MKKPLQSKSENSSQTEASLVSYQNKTGHYTNYLVNDYDEFPSMR